MAESMNHEQMRRARELFRDLVEFYRANGRPEQASACIDLAVRQELWSDPTQRPIDYEPGLLARPIHDASDFALCAYLEEHFPQIKAELARLEEGPETPFFLVEEPLLSRGRWDEVMFYEAGMRHDSAAQLLPVTAKIVDGLAEAVRQCGVIMISRLSPGSHIVPHCGFTNRRLRVHLGLTIPPDALMRVKDQFVEWQEGKCVVFDDSFEHEIWHYGDRPRLVLLIDIPHPEVGAAPERNGASDLTTNVQRFMRKQGLRKVELRPDRERPLLEPDDYHSRLIRRLLSELKTDVVTLQESPELAHGDA